VHWWLRWWSGVRRWWRVKPGELDGARGQDFGVKDGDGDERGDKSGLCDEGDERRPAVAAAE
jgi:hypothetical protein